jgi:VanZ family protein
VTMSLFRVAGLTCTLTLVVLSLLPGSERPHTGLPGQIEYVIAYCATAFFLGLRYSTARARVGVVLFLALLAAALELAQHWIPGRHSQIIDFVASSAGAGLGIVAVVIKDRWYRLSQRPWFTPL